MAWFDVSGGRLRFRRTSRSPVHEWLDSTEGAEAIQGAARDVRFSLLGRSRVARRRLTRTLVTAINSGSSRTALAAECEHYMTVWSQLAYAPALPRRTLDGQRLVVVPRTMIVGRSLAGTATRLGLALGSAVPEAFKAFFARWVLHAMNEAIGRAAPDPRRPLHARESWACVHVDPEYVWVVSFIPGDPWRGHVVMFEWPEAGLGRRERQALTAAIADLTSSLPNLNRVARDGTVRMAYDQMATMRF